jgi:hypothetical protein
MKCGGETRERQERGKRETRERQERGKKAYQLVVVVPAVEEGVHHKEHAGEHAAQAPQI